MKLLKLAFQSLKSRKTIFILSLVSVALSVSLILTLQNIKSASEEGFTQTISQVDLLVGARGGQLQLLLYSVFNMGSATNNVSYDSYLKWKNHSQVAWTIPYSLGDSYRGFRVVGTDQNFFEHYRFKGDQSLKLESGNVFNNHLQAVMGSAVARELKVKVGDKAVITHGVTKGAGVVHHDDNPFQIVGILKTTGTALDRSVYISLESMELIHQPDLKGNIEISSLTSFFVRTQNRIDTLRLQREINEWKEEPLMAIIPGAALSELWRNLSYFENALQVMVYLVAAFGIMTLVLLIFLTLDSRRKEMAVFRALGASPMMMASLLLIEVFILSFVGSLLGILFTRLGLLILGPFLQDQVGLTFNRMGLNWSEVLIALTVVVVSFFACLIPASKMQSQSLKDGLAPRL